MWPIKRTTPENASREEFAAIAWEFILRCATETSGLLLNHPKVKELKMENDAHNFLFKGVLLSHLWYAEGVLQKHQNVVRDLHHRYFDMAYDECDGPEDDKQESVVFAITDLRERYDAYEKAYAVDISAEFKIEVMLRMFAHWVPHCSGEPDFVFLVEIQAGLAGFVGALKALADKHIPEP